MYVRPTRTKHQLHSSSLKAMYLSTYCLSMQVISRLEADAQQVDSFGTTNEHMRMKTGCLHLFKPGVIGEVNSNT
jgi:hypothetical protein